MRIISGIMLCLVLMSSLIPCCAPVLGASEMPTAISCCSEEPQNSTPEPEQKSENDPNCACSPFFTCGVCSGFSFQGLMEFQLMDFENLSLKYGVYALNFDSVYSQDSWQPPKLILA